VKRKSPYDGLTFAQRIALDCVEDGDCIEWHGGLTNGHPSVRWEGKTVLIRRQLMGAIPKGKIARVTCGNLLCVNKGHIEITTYRNVAVECGRAGLMSGPRRSAKIAAAKRATCAKLTMEFAREVRASNESGAAISRRTGVSQAKISKIRLGKAWREFTGSILTGLFAA